MSSRFAAILYILFQVSSLNAQSKVILEANPNDIPSLAANYKLTIRDSVENRGIFAASSPDSNTLINILSDSRVLAAELDRDADVSEKAPASIASASVDAIATAALNRTLIPYYGATVRSAYVQQSAATIIRLGEAQAMSRTGSGIVAIIDTGVDPTHPALAASIMPGYDFTRDSEFVSEFADLDPLSAAALSQSTVAFLDTYAAKLNQSTVAFLDQSTVAFLDGRNLPPAFGHGTMVAGLVHLVAPNAMIMPLKAFRADGTSKISDIVRAIYYAVDHGASVINMSFSLTVPSPEITKALEFAASQNVIAIASAGNMGKTIKLYPAGNRYVIGVGSTNALDLRSSFSNYDVSSAVTSAPGEALITTFPGNHYAGVWGTSFSTALVTGAVDLMRQALPSASGSSIRDAIDHGFTIEQKMGDARLDLVRSLNYLTQD
jgi:subtilisin family serine protease